MTGERDGIGAIERQDAIGVIEREVAYFLRRAESARKDAGALDRSAYLLLGELAARGPLGIAALAALFQLDLSTASRQTAALEVKGLVERLPDPTDGRVSLLRITPRGRVQYQATRDARLALYAEILAGWSEQDRRQFGLYLARLNNAIARRQPRARAAVCAARTD